MRTFIGAIVTAIALFIGQAQAQFGDCADPAYGARFDSRIEAGPCEVIAEFSIRFDGNSVPMRVVRRIGDAHSDDARWISYVNTLADRVGPQMDAMGGLDIAPVTVFLTSLELVDASGAAHAAALGLDRPECRITFYKLEDEILAEEFVFTYAHELFHCVQHKTFRERSRPEAARWWVEGSAEYFAQLVQQGTSYSDGYFDEFDSNTLHKRLFDMYYENVVFFLWLGQTSGPTGVRNLLAAMPERGGFEEQRVALQRLIPLDTWIMFAEAYADGEIRQPGGRAVPKPRHALERFIIEGPARNTFYTEDYLLQRYVVAFKKGMTYSNTLEPEEGGVMRLRMSPASGMWDDPPSTVNACEDDKVYLALALSTDMGSGVSLATEASEILDERACCLIGDWVPTAESVTAEAELMNEMGGPAIAAHGANFSCAPAGGGWTLSFHGDGTGQVDWAGSTNRCTTTGPGGGAVQVITRNGKTGFNWTIIDRGAGRAEYTENSVMWTYTMFLGPTSITTTNADSGPSVRANGFAYQCTDTELSIQGIYGVNHREATYTRFGMPPAPTE
ncbi:MAG: hypothetical protein R3C55_06370 [Parvularculaceae bacterium]